MRRMPLIKHESPLGHNARAIHSDRDEIPQAAELFLRQMKRKGRTDHCDVIYLGLSPNAVRRMGIETVSMFLATAYPVLLRTVRRFDPGGTVGHLFSGSTDFLAFIDASCSADVLAEIHAAIVAPPPGAPLTAFRLQEGDVRVALQPLVTPLPGLEAYALNSQCKELFEMASTDERNFQIVARDLHGIIMEDRVRVALQPIVRLEDWHSLGFEALVRGPADSTYESAPALIAAAARTGNRDRLEEICRRKALESARALTAGTLLFMNVSLRHDVDDLVRTVRTTALDPRNIVIEVCEKTVFGDHERVAAMLDQCRSAGLRIALDDAGAGFTGLSVLAMYPWDFLKIDRGIISRIGRQREYRDLLGCITQYAGRIGAEVIAEGIEDEVQLSMCRQAGAQYGQGFLLGHPTFDVSTQRHDESSGYVDVPPTKDPAAQESAMRL